LGADALFSWDHFFGPRDSDVPRLDIVGVLGVGHNHGGPAVLKDVGEPLAVQARVDGTATRPACHVPYSASMYSRRLRITVANAPSGSAGSRGCRLRGDFLSQIAPG
jgi:hypothetical protein